MRIPYISLVAASAMALGGCAYDGLGLGMGYGPYGYSSYGYGSPYYGSGYYSYGGPSISVGIGSGYGGYPYYGGYGYGSPYYGWYDDYYYPGTGYYVYDSYRRPHMWSDSQRSYWTRRRQSATSSGIRTTTNWSAWQHNQSEAQRVNWHRVPSGRNH